MKSDQKKTAALKSSVPAVKRSAPLPSVRARAYRDFDDWAGMGDLLQETFNAWDRYDDGDFDRLSLAETRAALELAESYAAAARGQYIAAKVKEFEEGWPLYQRDELYEECPLSPNLLNIHSEYVLTRRVVGEQLAVMLATINQKPQHPKLYSRLMVEEIIAAKPSAVALESTTREIRRTMTFLPSAPEVLKVLRKEMERWSCRSEFGKDTLDYYRKIFDRRVSELKAKLMEQEALEKQLEQEREARLAKLEQERREMIAREERERRERVARQANEARERAAHRDATGFLVVWFRLLLLSRGVFIPPARQWIEDRMEMSRKRLDGHAPHRPTTEALSALALPAPRDDDDDDDDPCVDDDDDEEP
jgi:hypothetical protein